MVAMIAKIRRMPDHPSRRRFLAAIGGGAALVLGRPPDAAAFREMPMDAVTAGAAAAACGAAGDDHRQQAHRLAEANATLPADRRLSPEQLDLILARTACPLCGCAIGADRPD